MKRSEVPVKETWNLGLIYKDEKEGWADLDELGQLADVIEKTYKGKLDNAKNIVDCLKKVEKMYELCCFAINYFQLAMEVDFTNTEAVSNFNKVRNSVTSAFTKISFVESEIVEAPEEVLNEAIKNGGTVSNKIKRVLHGKKYILNPETEKALVALQDFMDTPYNVYSQAKLSDMKFDDFEVDGKKYPLSYALFEEEYEYETNTKVRRAAFENFSKKIKEYENVTATAYNAHVQRDKILCDLRGYKNVFESLLYPDYVSEELYNRQIDLITEKLAPHMRKYAKLIQKIYKLDKMTYADLKLSVDPDYDPKVTMEDARKYISEGLSILGEDYVKMVNQAFDERWIDYATNDGKCTGGFCSSPYGVPASFILLSWQGRMSDVFTLAHELGHAGHFKACNNAQGYFDTEVPLYYVESPSTMNELIMTSHMKKTNDDLRFKRWVISSLVGKTYYHNFVTHLLEAAYQREVYKIIEAGGSVQADTLSGIYRDILTKFWGDDVEITEGAELTWMRQPHYYMGLYSYTYSAGLTIATKACMRIEKEGQKAVDDWKAALKAGSTVSPEGFAKMAGVDISTDGPLLETIEYIGSLIDEICDLTEKLEK